jgi:hypothetical protein
MKASPFKTMLGECDHPKNGFNKKAYKSGFTTKTDRPKARVKKGPADGPIPDHFIRGLKIKIKHLAAEARIIRLEENKTRNFALWHRMNVHRRFRLRRVQRWNQLAYAFLRGRTYRSVEASNRPGTDYPNVTLIARVVYDFGAWFRPCRSDNAREDKMKELSADIRKWIAVGE